MQPRYRLGTVMAYGLRGILEAKGEYAFMVAQVPLPSGSSPIEQRRAARDAMAEKIVAALNATERGP